MIIMYNYHEKYQVVQNLRPVRRRGKMLIFTIGCVISLILVFGATYWMFFSLYTDFVHSIVSLRGISLLSISHKNKHRPLSSSSASSKIVCYYNFPDDPASLQINDIDSNLCTHLNLAFASVENNSIYLDPKHVEFVKEAVKLKQINANLKVLLSIGGASNTNGFPLMVLNHKNRKTFIQSVITFAKEHAIDGIDLDWEFPGEQPDFDKKQTLHFNQLLIELRKSIKKYSLNFLVTLAVTAIVEIIDVAYNVPEINKYVDFVNLMTYDFHFYNPITPFTGHNSPLYASSHEKYYLATLNINYSSHYWNSLGMDKNKIIVGLPTYGHSFRLMNPRNAGLYAPSSGFGTIGLKGFASYPQTCMFLQTNHVATVFDTEALSPYATKSYEWISFDDQHSLTQKTEFVKHNGFGGVMIYSLNTDDYKGVCNESGNTFPLVRAIKSVFKTRKIER